jgi:hypothetical protein
MEPVEIQLDARDMETSIRNAIDTIYKKIAEQQAKEKPEEIDQLIEEIEEEEEENILDAEE